MEIAAGKQEMYRDCVEVDGTSYTYEYYVDPNRPDYLRELALLIPGRDAIIYEYNKQKVSFRDALYKLVNMHHYYTALP